MNEEQAKPDGTGSRREPRPPRTAEHFRQLFAQFIREVPPEDMAKIARQYEEIKRQDRERRENRRRRNRRGVDQ